MRSAVAAAAARTLAEVVFAANKPHQPLALSLQPLVNTAAFVSILCRKCREKCHS
ncbi:MAG: hypothetical protein K8L97_32110 [Anaerolineae bacterium]|nr:hypothetical protein [Anaerolineae bacterium]